MRNVLRRVTTMTLTFLLQSPSLPISQFSLFSLPLPTHRFLTSRRTFSAKSTPNMTTDSGPPLSYLTQQEAAEIDETLMGPLGFSVDQLMELAGLSVVTSIAELESLSVPFVSIDDLPQDLSKEFDVIVDAIFWFFFHEEKMYFGYDPIEKEFKVMCMTWLPHGGSHEYQVLTLGTAGNLSWRKIQCSTIHYPHEEDDNGICINGLLYYQAIIDQKCSIVCFDVRSEKFSSIDIDQYLARKIWEPLILINCKNKLGAINCHIDSSYFVLWVLENAEEHKWSQNFYKIPQTRLSSSFFAAMIDSGEIVLYPNYSCNPLFIRYYNLEKNIITGVCFGVPALDYVEYGRVRIFPNFVEDQKLM